MSYNDMPRWMQLYRIDWHLLWVVPVLGIVTMFILHASWPIPVVAGFFLVQLVRCLAGLHWLD